MREGLLVYPHPAHQLRFVTDRNEALPSTALFNLGDIQLQQAVEPCHKFLPVTQLSQR